EFGFEGGDQLVGGADELAAGAFRRGADCLDGEARGDVDAELGDGADGERLAPRLHHHRQGGVARLVDAQVGGDDGGERDSDGGAAVIDLAGDLETTIDHLDLGGEGGLRPAEEAGEHLANVVGIVVHRLL